jgi:DNA-binding NarL/FixJ family response regulator
MYLPWLGEGLWSPCMITALLVDDYPAMRQLLRDILERYHDIQVIGEATTGEEAVVQAMALKPTVVVIDIQLPAMSGIEATTLIRRGCPSTTVIALTAGALDYTEPAMRHAGAATVLSKDDLLQRLYPAIIEEAALNKITSYLESLHA